MFKKEFEEVFRGMTLQGLAVLFISHDKTKEVTRPDGTSYTKTVPTVSDSINNIVKNMADIIGYGYQEFGTENRFMILRSDGTIEAGTRFPYMQAKIPFSYESLVSALNKAIDKEEEHNGAGAVTSERTVHTSTPIDFDAIIEEFNTLIMNIPGSSDIEEETEDGKRFKEFYQPRISKIIESYLGRGKKVRDATEDQAEIIKLILEEVKELVAKESK